MSPHFDPFLRSTTPYFNKKTAESEAAKVALEVNQNVFGRLNVAITIL